ncbi:hypothetical protein DEJ50_17480 [Streptomyces venezuelae]|uniref:Flavodoxin n=1 Tax=Streptomyces venezuelae TaxID=54571 RepID=A0A5P2D3L6_STRVZ|nr:hypothetical protein [Streptomyces venezuelae]QES49333.1 hypothetical protein DEJ50_17480 [Streptomyces venezuelae]
MASKTPLIAVVHRGPQGRASAQAFAVRDGVAEAGVRSVLIGAESLGEAQWALLEAAGGYMFGAPLPEWAAARRNGWSGKPAGGFAESVREGPEPGPYARQRRLEAFATGLGMRWIVPQVLPSWYSACGNEAALDSVRQLGGLVARTLCDGLAHGLAMDLAHDLAGLGRHAAQTAGPPDLAGLADR